MTFQFFKQVLQTVNLCCVHPPFEIYSHLCNFGTNNMQQNHLT